MPTVTPSLFAQRLKNHDELVAPEGNLSPEYRAVKRIMDWSCAVVLIVVMSPLLLAIWLLLAITTKGRPFFVQERVGYLGRRFRMVKFRTMRLDAEKLQHLVANQHAEGPIFKSKADPRITPIGRFLRKTSMDELPQLWNVLVGDMALVGPRPPLVKEVADYKPWQRRRLSVMPGLTCLWQVSGRSEIGFEDWVRMDIWYLEHQNLWTDVKLLVQTPWTVMTGKGAY